MKNSVVINVPVEVITGEEASLRFKEECRAKYYIVCGMHIIEFGDISSDFGAEFRPMMEEAIKKYEVIEQEATVCINCGKVLTEYAKPRMWVTMKNVILI